MDQQKPPAAQHGLKRAREAAGGGPPHHHHPLATLLEQIRRLKLPSIPADTANRLLGPFIREALRLDERGTLLAIVQQFGWQGGGEFTQAIDLGSFSLLLQKYRYERLQELGSGSYAVVYKARNRETDEVIALKKLRFGFDEQGLPSSTLREISLLKELKHANIVELKDIIYGFGTNNVYVVLECLDCDLRHLLDAERQLDTLQIKSFLHQILLAVNHAHMHCVMHRDLKPQNILVDASHTAVKVADFGLARSFLPPFKAYTDKVVTLWYRAPELLLGVASYSTAIDMWSVGCILAEMLNREPLFRAESEIGLLHKIFEALGTPNDAMWAGVQRLSHYRDNFPQWQPKAWEALVPRLAADPLGADLLASMLAYDPEARISAAQALRHPWFNELQQAGGGVAMQQDVAAGAPPPAGTSQAAAAAAGDGGRQQPPAGPGMLGGRPVQMRSAFEQQLVLQQHHQQHQQQHQQQQQTHLQLPRFQPPQQLLQMQQPSVFSFPPQLSMPAAAAPPRPPQQVAAAAAAAAAAANTAAAAAAAAGLQAGCHPAAWARHQHVVPQHPAQPQQAAGHPSGVTPA